MEILGIIFLSLASILLVFIYHRHDKEIKQRTERFKYHQYKIEEEKEDDPNVIVGSNVMHVQKGSRIVKVYQ